MTSCISNLQKVYIRHLRWPWGVKILLKMTLLSFKCFYFPSNSFAFLQYLFKYFLLSFKNFLLLSFKYFLLSFKYLLLLSFKYFLLLSFKYFLLISFKYFFAFLQIFLHYFKFYCFPLKLSFYLKKIRMTKFYQLENQSIWNKVLTRPLTLWLIYQAILF